MTDWTRELVVSWEAWRVSPAGWGDARRVAAVDECSVTYSASDATVATATMTADEPLAEAWLRVYLVAEQDGRTERHALATLLCKSCRKRFDAPRGLRYECELYSALEVAAGFQLEKGASVSLERGYARAAAQVLAAATPAPVVQPAAAAGTGSYAADPDNPDALTMASSLAAKGGMRLTVDPFGRITLEPARAPSALSRSFTFRTGDESVLMPELSDDRDTFDIPNRVRVYDDRGGCGVAVDNAVGSPTGRPARGYWQDGDGTATELPAGATQSMLDEEAARLLAEQSSRPHKLRVVHGYCGLGLWEGVGIEHPEAGIEHVTAQVVSTTVQLDTRCLCTTELEYL